MPAENRAVYLPAFGLGMIYLDNNATTPLDPRVQQVMNQVAVDAYGNPGSRHAAGRKARLALDAARERIAECLDAAPDELLFTSGGTESANLAIFGLTAGRTGVILQPAGEHPATAEPIRQLLKQSWRQIELPISASGRWTDDALSTIPDDHSVQLATALLANNETGVIQEVTPLSNWCQARQIPLFLDAVQAVGKIDVAFHKLNAAALSFAAHKFHGPRGIGGLLVRRGTRLLPLFRGGFQERGLRPGTEPVVLAVGMAEALSLARQEQQTRNEHLRMLRDRLEAGLLERCAPAQVNGDRQHRLPNTLNIAFPGIDGEALLVLLDFADVCASLGSACASGSVEPSPVLQAMQLPEEVLRSSLRLSVGVQNTVDEVDAAIAAISRCVRQLRDARRH